MIQHVNWRGQPAYLLENERLQIVVLKNFGAKIASIFHKETNFEVLFQPTLGRYQQMQYDDEFSAYDTSGLDDTLPTIDACLIDGQHYPDHGDVWSIPWTMEEQGEILRASVQLRSAPLKFQRAMELSGETLLLHYQLKNISNKTVPYLWALHGLMRVVRGTRIVYEPALITPINVIDHEVYPFDVQDLSAYPAGASYKYYFKEKAVEGRVKVIHPNLSITMDYDPEKFPYLGTWFTKGGFKGEVNVAVEPSNGYYDSLKRAIENDKVEWIDAGETKEWTVTLSMKKEE